MSESTHQPQLFADIVPRPGAGALYIRMIGPTLGAREVPILKGMTGPAIDNFGSTLKCIILDLTLITYMNSAALGLLVECRTHGLQSNNAKTILLNPSDEVLAILKMVKFDKLFTIARNADDLEKAMGQ